MSAPLQDFNILADNLSHSSPCSVLSDVNHSVHKQEVLSGATNFDIAETIPKVVDGPSQCRHHCDAATTVHKIVDDHG